MGPKLKKINPFELEVPIEEPRKFIGRHDSVQYMTNALLGLQNVILCGERGIGKTSLLLYLAHSDSSSNLPDNHISIYFDFTKYNKVNPVDLWQAIANATAEKIQQIHPDQGKVSDKFMEILEDFLSSSSHTLLSTGLGGAFSYLDDFGLKIHFLFDEFDRITKNPNFDDLFYDVLRSLPRRAGNVSYVVATRSGLVSLQRKDYKREDTLEKLGLDFLNTFTTIVLRPFQKNEAKKLIFNYFSQSGMSLSLARDLWDSASELYEFTGYHPLLLQAFCYYLLEEMDSPRWPLGEAWQKALSKLDKTVNPYFYYYWQNFSKEEKELMLEIALGKTDNEISRYIAKNLEERGLIVKARTGWEIFSSCFVNWIRKRSFSNRDSLLEILVGQSSALITGPPGIGKTWLGERVKAKQQGPVFTYTFHEEDIGGDSLIFEISDFLHKKERGDLRRYLKRLTSQAAEWNEELRLYLTEDLYDFSLFLWFDDVHQALPDSLNKHLLRWLVKHKPDKCQLLLTSRDVPNWWNDIGLHIPLNGLTAPEARIILDKLSLSNEQFEFIQQHLNGHPLLLELFIIVADEEGTERALRLVENVSTSTFEVLISSFLEYIWENLESDDKSLLFLLALLDKLESQAFVESIGSLINLADIRERIDNLQNKLLIKIHESHRVALFNDEIKAFVNTHIIKRSSVPLLLKIAKAYENRAEDPIDWLQAGKYYRMAKKFKKSAIIFVKYGDDLGSVYCRKYLSELKKFSNSNFPEENYLWQQLLEVKGKVALQVGDHEIALESYQALSDLTENPKWMIYQGRVYNRQGETKNALAVLTKAQSKLRSSKDSLLRFQARVEYARALTQSVQTIQKAIRFFKEALQGVGVDLDAIFALISDQIESIDFVIALGKVDDYFSELSLNLKGKDEIAWALRYMGLAYIRLGEVMSALVCWLAAQNLWRRLGDVVNVAAMQANIGGISDQYKLCVDQGERFLEEARYVLESQEALYDLIRTLNNLAGVYAWQGKYDKALDTLNRLFELRGREFAQQMSETFDMQAIIYSTLQEWNYAERCFDKSILLAESINDEYGKTHSILNKGLLLYLARGRMLPNDQVARREYNLAQAKECFQTVMDSILEPQDDEDQLRFIEAYAGLTEIYLYRNELHKAHDCIKKIEPRISIAKELASWMASRAFWMWGKVLYAQNNIAEAEKKFLKGWDILSSYTVVDGQLDIVLLTDLIVFYEKLGKSAAKYKNKLDRRLLNYQLSRDKLEDIFIQTTDTLLKTTKVIEPISCEEHPGLWAKWRLGLANDLLSITQDAQSRNIERAIALYQSIATPSIERECVNRLVRDFPEVWAMAQSRLGHAYENRLQGKREDNLRIAIECYQNALSIYEKEIYPEQWADTQSNLGDVYIKATFKNWAENRAKAIRHYQNALEVYSDLGFSVRSKELQRELLIILD